MSNFNWLLILEMNLPVNLPIDILNVIKSERICLFSCESTVQGVKVIIHVQKNIPRRAKELCLRFTLS